MAGGAGGADGLGCTEEYDGSTFSSGGNMIAGRQGGSGGGTQNAAIYTMGYAPPASVACTEHYNGSSWSAGGSMICARRAIGSTGTEYAALGFGGYVPSSPKLTDHTEEYYGQTWAVGGALSTATAILRGAQLALGIGPSLTGAGTGAGTGAAAGLLRPQLQAPFYSIREYGRL